MMLETIFLENEELLVHSFRSQDMDHFEKLTQDIFSILSDEWTLKYIPEKRLHNLQQAELLLQTAILNYHSRQNYLHFITHKASNKVIGMIDVITPELARKHYHMDYYPFFIEFYLSSAASGCYIMTEILPKLMEELLRQGISKIGAVINRENIAARRVLEKANFEFKAPFDVIQDFYQNNHQLEKVCCSNEHTTTYTTCPKSNS
ncbi:GNAT family N-acetyltransferase [Pedobacter sp. ASV1-7]|uniref:GNAT family N-acetyltransferase n=1 Tax=Pedobacter sp. ASV1-7 TaxID=3145237 RepID=UPI0032E88E92